MQNVSENILKYAKKNYPNRVCSHNSHESVLNACNPKESNKTGSDPAEILPRFENPFKTKLSEIHNYAENQSLKIVTVNMYRERKTVGNS